MTQTPRQRPINRARALAPAVLLTVALTAAELSQAQNADGLTVSASAAALTDSNLFRLPSDANTFALIGRDGAADQITVTSLGVNYSKDYSLQRVELNLNLANYRYQNFSFLNNTSNNYSAAWRWSISPRFRGNLTTDRKETVNDFTDVRGLQQSNQRTNITSRLDGAYELGGAWRLTGAATEATQTNPQGQTSEADTLTRSVEGGLRYVYPSGSQWSYSLRTSKGNYLIAGNQALALIDDSFNQIENEVTLAWAIDGSSSAFFRVTGLNRTHPKFGERDFSGISASANYNLMITGKSSVAIGLTRDLSSYQTSTSNYAQTDRLTFTPTWAITAKTQLRLNCNYAQRTYLGAPTAQGANALHRTDTLSDTALSFDWHLQPRLTLSASVQHSRRSANLPGLDFQSTSTSISAQYSF